MLKNYIKMAFKVMMRRKFFTFISLFGISFTLMVLTIFLSLLDTHVGAMPPEVYKDRILYLDRIFLSKDGKNEWRADASIHFIQEHIKSLQTPEEVSIFSRGHSISHLSNNKLEVFYVKYTDAAFWKVLQFKFIEGKPYSQKDIENGNKLVVISKEARNRYFDGENALGKYIESRDVKYKVIGVVDNPPYTSFIASEIWMPYTLDSPKEINKKELNGRYMAMILAKNGSDFDAIRKELDHSLKRVSFTKPDEVNTIRVYPQSRFEEFAQGVNRDMSLAKSLFVVFLIMAIIMLLPAINLMNINVSRILERSSEIGIRKAFGASSLTLIGQFVTENVILTLIGGAIGFLLAIAAADMFIMVANSLDPLGHTIPAGQFHINWRIFSFSMLTYLFFGLVSGLYPAYKMSRLHAVYALKGGNI